MKSTNNKHLESIKIGKLYRFTRQYIITEINQNGGLYWEKILQDKNLDIESNNNFLCLDYIIDEYNDGLIIKILFLGKIFGMLVANEFEAPYEEIKN